MSKKDENDTNDTATMKTAKKNSSIPLPTNRYSSRFFVTDERKEEIDNNNWMFSEVKARIKLLRSRSPLVSDSFWLNENKGTVNSNYRVRQRDESKSNIPLLDGISDDEIIPNSDDNNCSLSIDPILQRKQKQKRELKRIETYPQNDSILQNNFPSPSKSPVFGRNPSNYGRKRAVERIRKRQQQQQHQQQHQQPKLVGRRKKEIDSNCSNNNSNNSSNSKRNRNKSVSNKKNSLAKEKHNIPPMSPSSATTKTSLATTTTAEYSKSSWSSPPIITRSTEKHRRISNIPTLMSPSSSTAKTSLATTTAEEYLTSPWPSPPMVTRITRSAQKQRRISSGSNSNSKSNTHSLPPKEVYVSKTTNNNNVVKMYQDKKYRSNCQKRDNSRRIVISHNDKNQAASCSNNDNSRRSIVNHSDKNQAAARAAERIRKYQRKQQLKLQQQQQ